MHAPRRRFRRGAYGVRGSVVLVVLFVVVLFVVVVVLGQAVERRLRLRRDLVLRDHALGVDGEVPGDEGPLAAAVLPVFDGRLEVLGGDQTDGLSPVSGLDLVALDRKSVV